MFQTHKGIHTIKASPQVDQQTVMIGLMNGLMGIQNQYKPTHSDQELSEVIINEDGNTSLVSPAIFLPNLKSTIEQK